MRKIAIVTDCTADLPVELAAQRDITVVPLYLIWGDEQLRAGIDITNEAFYTRLVKDPVLPHTSQPTPADFLNLFRQLDAEQIVLFVVSEQLSGTYASALAAAEEYEGKVTVVNSRTASMSLGWQVLAAADARDRGASVPEIVAAADAVRRSSLFLLCPITLEYLYRGGRLGAATKLLGTALQIKPILKVNPVAGVVESFEKVRTRAKSLVRMVEATWERLKPAEKAHIAVLHGSCPEDAQQVADILAEQHPAEVIISEMGPIVGAHTGPGIIGIAGYAG